MKKVIAFILACIISIAVYANMNDSCGSPNNQVVVTLEKVQHGGDMYRVVARGYGVNANNTVTFKVKCVNGTERYVDGTIDIKNGVGATDFIYHKASDIQITNRYCIVQ